jgi:hypothetical protein
MARLIVYDGIDAEHDGPRGVWWPTSGRGRPASYREPLVSKTVTLPISYVEQLTTFGAGNLSDGIRSLVALAYTRNGKPWFSPPRMDP